MPWNDNKGGGGGPWGGGGGNNSNNGSESPWGKPPGGGSGGPGGPGKPGGGGKDRPDLEETLRRMQERFRRKGGSGGNGAGGSGRGGGRGFGVTGVVIILALAVVGWALTGVYQVDERQRAVVLRFGTFARFEEPGFRLRLPSPIEQHYIVEVNTEKRTPIGGENQPNLMLTGDENIVDIGFVINWRIYDPNKYLFNVVDETDGRNELIEQIGESAMREVVGTSAFEPITTGDRTGVEARVKALMQQTLNSYDSGVEIISIAIGKATAPEEVAAVQRDVSSAEQNRAKREADAVAHRNRVVPEAEGRARAILQEAEGYKQSVVAEAKGAADAFNLIYAEYRAAPRVTRERLFLEMMEKVLGRTDNTIIDTKSGAVPIIPLDQLRGRQPAPQGQ
jgi:membrane protease subunit HflK